MKILRNGELYSIPKEKQGVQARKAKINIYKTKKY